MVAGFTNDEAMNLLLEGAVDPSLTERVFEEQNRAELLCQDAKSCSSGNQGKIDEFRKKYEVLVYNPESPQKVATHSKEIKEAIEMIRADGLKTWLEFKETGHKPTPKPSTNFLIPVVKPGVNRVEQAAEQCVTRRLAAQRHLRAEERGLGVERAAQGHRAQDDLN